MTQARQHHPVPRAWASCMAGAALLASALPGWAAVEPLRRLIADRAATFEGDTLSRAKEALAYARRLADAGALYFSNNPAALATLATMEQMGPAYVVHETMHAHWVPMYFADLARELAKADLHFVGQLPLHLNYRDLAVPEGVADALIQVTDRAEFEGLKDYALTPTSTRRPWELSTMAHVER